MTVVNGDPQPFRIAATRAQLDAAIRLDKSHGDKPGLREHRDPVVMVLANADVGRIMPPGSDSADYGTARMIPIMAKAALDGILRTATLNGYQGMHAGDAVWTGDVDITKTAERQRLTHDEQKRLEIVVAGVRAVAEVDKPAIHKIMVSRDELAAASAFIAKGQQDRADIHPSAAVRLMAQETASLRLPVYDAKKQATGAYLRGDAALAALTRGFGASPFRSIELVVAKGAAPRYAERDEDLWDASRESARRHARPASTRERADAAMER